jgi:ribosome recycling factor
VIQPFDRSLIGTSRRGFNRRGPRAEPRRTTDSVIRVPIPPLNEERRKEFVKVLHQMAEEGRVSIRHARREGNDQVKGRLKESRAVRGRGAPEMDEIQRLTDDYIQQGGRTAGQPRRRRFMAV